MTPNNNEDKRGRGRPRTETKLPEGWKDIIIQSGIDGKHITDFLITLGISWDAHWAMMDRSKEYNRAVQDYLKYCEQYWYNMAQEHMEETGGAAFNSRLWSLIVRNKFPKNWSESTKVDVTTQGEKIVDDKNITIEIVKPKSQD
jgi:hypothetical protein